MRTDTAANGDRLRGEFRWYVVQTRAQREKFVAAVLGQKGYDCFLPVLVPFGARRWKRARPLFPGYLFCYADLTDRRTPLLATESALRLLGFGGDPCPLPDEEVGALQSIADAGLPVRPIPELAVGARVRITDGPLRGVEGLISRVRKHERFLVQVTLLRRSVSVAL